MIRHRSAWRLAGLLGLTLVVPGLAWTQEAPPAPPALEDGDVRLAYKFRPGAVYRYRCSATGTMTLDLSGLGAPTGPGQMPGAMPMDLTMQFDIIQKVKGVAPDGSATVSQRLDDMTMNYRMMGRNMAMKVKDGKMTMTMNGQPVPAAPNVPQGNPFAGQSFDVRLAPTGRMLEVKAALAPALKQLFAGQDFRQLFGVGMPGLGMLAFPAEAVRVGQPWEDKTSVDLPVPLPGNPGGATGPKAEYRTQNTLREVQQKGARQIAVIDSKTEVTMPRTEVSLPQQQGRPGPASVTMDKYSQSVTATHYFDVAAGELRMGDFATKLGMQMQMAIPGAPPGKPGTMGFDGNFTMKVALQPNPPAKAAPAKATPAKPRPARKNTRRR